MTPLWAGWALAIAVLFLYFMIRAMGHELNNTGIRSDLEQLRREIAETWGRCGMLEGFADAFADRVVKTDPFPDSFDPIVEAAKDWIKWRQEQFERSGKRS
jgi:hypothetical protein